MTNVDVIDPERRELLGVTLAAAVGLPLARSGVTVSAMYEEPAPSTQRHGGRTMNWLKVKDGTDIFYRDWGTGQPVVFSHGWPLAGEAWDPQLLFLLGQGYRVIAHDRRGHGRSGQPSGGNDMDTYADDLAQLIESLDLTNAVLVGHSTGGGEVTRYLGRHGTKRVRKAVIVGAIPPIMLQTPANPGGVPLEVFDGIRARVATDRALFYRELASGPFFGFNRPGATASQGLIDGFVMQGMAGGVKGQYECIKQFSESEFTEDLKKIDIPMLIVHGDDDQVVPIATTSAVVAKLVKGSTYKVYPGGSHGLAAVQQAQFNADLLAFIRQ